MLERQARVFKNKHYMAYLISLFSLAGILIIYFLIYRPWNVRWGSTDDEIKLTLPGDDIVVKPNFNATRAITINTVPENIWPWIIQIGSLRAGWYSINLLDNAGKPSSNVILPQWQKIENDYFIPFTPDQKNGMWVKEFKSNAMYSPIPQMSSTTSTKSSSICFMS